MDIALPIAFVVLLWWSSTVVLLYRCGKPVQTYRNTLIGTGVAAVLGLLLIALSRNAASSFGAYAGFTGALAIWALHETSYLLGFVTGPRPKACPEGASLRERFWFGLQASLYHELAIVATAGLIALLCWNATHQTAFYTFVILWLMRWSVKINIFLGVRNLHHEFWPVHLQYLQSYARTRAMNMWFPLAMIGAVGAATWLTFGITGTGVSNAELTSAVLLLSILALATIEHIFLMFPVPDAVLWRTGTRSRESAT